MILENEKAYSDGYRGASEGFPSKKCWIDKCARMELPLRLELVARSSWCQSTINHTSNIESNIHFKMRSIPLNDIFPPTFLTLLDA